MILVYLLKQRIIVLLKSRSIHIAPAKYGLSAPLFVLMLILSSATVNNSKALKNITTKAEDVLFVAAPVLLADTVKDTQQPSFPGGKSALDAYMGKNVRYPIRDRENNIQGKVNLQFAIETDGSVTDVIAISGPSQSLKDASIVAMKNSPKWIPGYKDGKVIKMPYSYEVSFTIGDGISNRTKIFKVVDNNVDNQVFAVLETQPKFPGGIQSFLQYLGKNVKYPAEDRKNNLQGKVIVQFVIERNGSLTDIKAISSPSNAMSEEAVRVVSSSPKWIPGMQGGSFVRSQFTVPITFTLDNSKTTSNGVTDAVKQ
ncbi:MAG: TonB family protein [Sphingobacteriaceae bacterium]|nr:MAG: TonB family protein [Sphingobacteriaceae bacterium]